jgi:diacylglycerol kinase
MRGQSSFAVHAGTATLVVITAALLQCTIDQWCLLLLCIALVLTAEVFNSALEVLAKAIDADHNPFLADGLDIASGAVLISALGAALVGSIVLLQALIAVLPG